MLPTFVIGLREGLEAALIVGIVAAFLRQQGRLDVLRWVFAGVAAAVALCLGVGILLDAISRDLPQRQQEGLETVVGGIAVLMVTYMVLWMRRHSRDLKRQLEEAAGGALLSGSGWALVAMAFLAVMREGFETVVFLLATFNEAGGGASAVTGAVLGILVAVGLGWGIYRGGVRINLSRFFRVTGLVLVLVAAGLVVTALRTAHEAGWLNVGQQRTVDLSWLVRPGSVQSSLLTGILGMQARPVLIEVVGWLVYLIPIGLFVAWPAGRRVSPSTAMRWCAVGAGACVVLAGAALVAAPSRPSLRPPTTNGRAVLGQVVAVDGTGVTVRASVPGLLDGLADPGGRLRLDRQGAEVHDGVQADRYDMARSAPATDAPATITLAEVAARNGGRLPIGVHASDLQQTVPASTTVVTTVTAWIDPATDRVLDLQGQTLTTTMASLSVGPTVLGTPSSASAGGFPPAVASQAAHAARSDAHDASARRWLHGAASGLLATAVVALAVSVGLLVSRRRTPHVPAVQGRLSSTH